MINISIISGCNNKCSYCFQKDSYHKKGLMLQMDEILDIFDWAKGAPKMGILGGEPTLHPECARICAESVQRFPTMFFTNLLCKQSLLEEIINLNMTWLINTNSRKELLGLFDENIEYINKIKPSYTIGFGTTLTGKLSEDIRYIDRLIALGKKYPDLVKIYRIALASPSPDEEYKLVNFDKSIEYFYTLLEKEKQNQVVSFDCCVNYCQLSNDIMTKIKNDPRTYGIRHFCSYAMIEILADKSVTFCSSLPSEIFNEITTYKMFKHWVECADYIDAYVRNFMDKYSYFCKNTTLCKSKDCSGPCFAALANLVKQEEKKPIIIQKFHQLRRDLFN